MASIPECIALPSCLTSHPCLPSNPVLLKLPSKPSVTSLVNPHEDTSVLRTAACLSPIPAHVSTLFTETEEPSMLMPNTPSAELALTKEFPPIHYTGFRGPMLAATSCTLMEMTAINTFHSTTSPWRYLRKSKRNA